VYLSLMQAWCGRRGVRVWAYCLMPNDVHLTVVPPSEDALSRAIGEAHRRYTRRVNFRPTKCLAQAAMLPSAARSSP
jgi:putative transposase